MERVQRNVALALHLRVDEFLGTGRLAATNAIPLYVILERDNGEYGG